MFYLPSLYVWLFEQGLAYGRQLNPKGYLVKDRKRQGGKNTGEGEWGEGKKEAVK